MFLSRVLLNAQRRRAWGLLSSRQRLHAAVLACNPPQPSADSPLPAALEQETAIPEGRVLWRLDQSRHETILYTVTPARPDFTSLVEQAGWPDSEQTARTADYTGFLDHLEAGQRWGFRLTGNAVRSIPSPDQGDGHRARGVRVAHVTVPQKEQWFAKQATKFGFTPDRATVVGMEKLRFQRGSGIVTLDATAFEGALTVTDPSVLRRGLSNGIGKGKAYGLGLLTLARLS